MASSGTPGTSAGLASSSTPLPSTPRSAGGGREGNSGAKGNSSGPNSLAQISEAALLGASGGRGNFSGVSEKNTVLPPSATGGGGEATAGESTRALRGIRQEAVERPAPSCCEGSVATVISTVDQVGRRVSQRIYRCDGVDGPSLMRS